MLTVSETGKGLSGLVTRIRSNLLLTIIVVMTLLVPLCATSATNVRWHGAMGMAFEIGVVALLAAAAARASLPRVSEWFSGSLRLPNRGVVVPLVLLVILAAVSAVVSAHRTFAVTGFLQLAGGVLVFLVVSAQLRERWNFELLLDGLIAITVTVSVLGFAVFGAGQQTMSVSVFNDHQLLGSFLLLMLPVMLMAGGAPTSPSRRMAAQVAALLAGTCLLLAQTRSSWIGAVCALVVLFLLSRRYLAHRSGKLPVGLRRQRTVQLLLPAVLVGCILVLFVVLSHMGSAYAHRAGSLQTAAAGQDGSFQSREQSWRGAIAMVKARPVTGWGIGSYAIYQNQFSHVGRSAATVLAVGPSLAEQAHDFYLQLAAELGVPGLALWVLFLAAFLVTTIRSLSSRPKGSLQQRLLIAAVAAVCGQIIDAFANPAWQFSQIALFFWVIAGLGMAASSSRERVAQVEGQSDARTKARHTRARNLRPRYATCALLALAILPYIVNNAWACASPSYQPSKCCYRLVCNGINCPDGSSFNCPYSNGKTGCNVTCYAYECKNNGPWEPVSCTNCSCYVSSGKCSASCSGSTISCRNVINPHASLSCKFSDGGTCGVTLCPW